MREEKRWLRHFKWAQPFFSFGCKSYKESCCKGQSQTSSPIKQKIPYSESKNIRESILNFTARFGEINPDMLYPVQTGVVGGRKGRFCLFPLCSEGVNEKKR